jgi:hypothetical protein
MIGPVSRTAGRAGRPRGDGGGPFEALTPPPAITRAPPLMTGEGLPGAVDNVAGKIAQWALALGFWHLFAKESREPMPKMGGRGASA